MKDETTKILGEKTKWKEVGEAMKIVDSGAKGFLLISNGEEMWEMFRLDISKVEKGGPANFVKPLYEALAEWGADKSEVDEVVRKAIAKASLIEKVR